MQKSNPLTQVWLAFVLLTRLPLPHLPPSVFSSGAHAVWAYPLVGLVVGAVGVVLGQLALMINLPLIAAAIICITAMMLLTGAMHEDGLADVFDGFWGGYTPERRLEIMRDSQIGTYGVLALVVVTLLRITAVTVLLEDSWRMVIVAAVVSRAIMPVLMYALPHARNNGLSQSVGHPNFTPVAVTAAIGLAVLLIGLGRIGLTPLAICAVVTIGMMTLAKRKIGGQTGDVLGAVQQLGEGAILLSCTALV